MAEKTLMKGNHALAEGVIYAGSRFFAGYPITPQNEIPEYMSVRMPAAGGVFIQTESELAAINMLFGAASTGARVMTSSSSPGISLMQEGLSYIAGADIPVLVANVVRGGPGLGNIAPSQADYFQATRGGGHGDYYTIVLAPDSAQECFTLPKLGYELAEKYRIPVMILADGMLGQMMEPVEFNYEPVDPKTFKPQDWWLTGCQGRGRRVIRSYDLAPGKLEEWNWRRWNEKYMPILKNEQRYQATNCDDAQIVVIGYGTCARICGAAVRQAREQGIKAGLLRPITLWPFPKDILAELAKKAPDMLVVEMSMGQMIEDVQLATECRAKVHLHGRPGGGIPTPNEVLEKIRAIAGGKK